MASLLVGAATPGSAEEGLEIVAPGSAGGGWDQTARAMAQVLEKAGIASSVEVVNSPGAGGAIGLAQFASAHKGDGHALLVGGLFMVGAIRTSGAAVSLLDTAPIARLTGEYAVIAVPVASDLKTLDELVQALRADPGAIAWAGGSGGGGDQLLLSLLARAIGVEPVQVHYVPFSGGGEVAAALLHNEVTAGVSGYGELEPYIRSGKLRALAISAERRMPGIDIRTLKEQGIDVTFMNWRGVFAAPGISDAQRAALSTAIDDMVKHEAWKAKLAQHRWVDLYLPGEEFTRFIRDEQARAAAGPDPRGITRTSRSATMWSRGQRAFLARPVLSSTLLGASLLLIGFVSWRWFLASRRERVLSHDLQAAAQDLQAASQHLEAARDEAKRSGAEAEDLLKGLGEQIERQFQVWGLTAAEREVASLMLKGLRHKEIANIRGTSERTIRQQALTIYKKAGLDGRADLAAYFMEDLLQPHKRPGARPA